MPKSNRPHGPNPTTTCPCGTIVQITWNWDYDDGWDVCQLTCPECGRRSTGGYTTVDNPVVNSWMTATAIDRSQAAIDQMEFEADLYQETGIRYGN